MLRIRSLIERGRRHPVLGIVVVLLLAVLLVLVALHSAHDGLEHDAAMVCLALVVAGVVLTASLRPPLRSVARSERLRAPPAPFIAHAVSPFSRSPDAPRPLRL